MLALAGFLMVAAFMALIMTKRMTPGVALTVVPIIAAVLLGTPPDAIGKMAMDGIKIVAPTGVMLMFAILYFGLMIDAGLFEPVVGVIVRIVHGDARLVVVGTAVLAALISLDGDGATTYMITVAAMLPLYQRLGLNPLCLTCVTMLASGVMNLTPWGGPLSRAATSLQLDPASLFVPMIPTMVVGVLGVCAIAAHLGKQESVRLKAGMQYSGERTAALGPVTSEGGDAISMPSGDSVPPLSPVARPTLIVFNALLTVAIIAGLIEGIFPIALLFMLGFAIALMINYPRIQDQRERLVSHSGNVISVVSIIFAAGIFTGILDGTGMVSGMSNSFVGIIPPALGPHMAPLTAAASMPFTFFISNDAFYFGMLPIIAEAGGHFDVAEVEIARASLIGQPVHLLSPLVPSTFLLVGLAGVELGDHQRFTLKWAVLLCTLMAIAAMVSGAFALN